MHNFQSMIKSCSNDLCKKTNDSDHHNQIYQNYRRFTQKKEANKNGAFLNESWVYVQQSSN